MSPSRRQFLLSSVAAGSLLAGCTGTDDGGTGTGTPTSSLTPAPEPTVTRTEPPQTGTPTGPPGRTRRQTGESPLAVVGETAAYVAADGSLRALVLDDGTEAWRRSPGPTAALVYAGSTLFSLTDDGTVRSHASDGSPRWTADLDAPGRSLALSDATVVVLGLDGTLAGFAASDGAERWRTSVEKTVVGLAADAERAYVAGDSPARLLAFASADGTRHWQVRPGKTVTAPPAVVDGRVLVGVEFPGYEPSEGTRTPTPMPTDAPAAGGALAYAPDGSRAWKADVEGTPSWFVGVDGGMLVGYRGFTFSDPVHGVVPQVSGLTDDGEERWRHRQVPFRKRTAVTRGVALHVDPREPKVVTDDDERVPRGQTALRSDSGETVWTGETGAATAAAAGEVFVTVEADAVRARGALSGAERWATGR